MVGKQTRRLFTVTRFYVDVISYIKGMRKKDFKNEASFSVYLPRQLPSNNVSDLFPV